MSGLFSGKYPAQPIADVQQAPAPSLYPTPASDGPSPAGAISAAAPSPAGADLARILQGINDHAAMLMALGGATMSGGLGKGFQAAAATAEKEDKNTAANAGRAATFHALLAAGLPPAIAQAAAGNPAVLKAVTGRGVGQVPETVRARLAGGGEAVLKWDPEEGRYVQLEGQGIK